MKNRDIEYINISRKKINSLIPRYFKRQLVKARCNTWYIPSQEARRVNKNALSAKLIMLTPLCSYECMFSSDPPFGKNNSPKPVLDFTFYLPSDFKKTAEICHLSLLTLPILLSSYILGWLTKFMMRMWSNWNSHSLLVKV